MTVVSEESSIYKVLVSPAQDPGGSSGSHTAQHSLIPGAGDHKEAVQTLGAFHI